MILNRSHKLLPLLLSLMVAVASTVVIPAIPTTTENCLSTSTSLSITKYHLYHKNPSALTNWSIDEKYGEATDPTCPIDDTSAINPAKSPVTELVMMATPRCKGNDPKYYFEALWDHTANSSEAMYRIDSVLGGPTYNNYYTVRSKYCKSTTTLKDTSGISMSTGASFTVLVTTSIKTTIDSDRKIRDKIEDSDANVFARVIPEGDGVIYTTYNTTNGTDYCNQKYVPLMADDIYSELTVNQDGSGDQMYVPLMADDKDNELTVNQDGSGTQLTIRWTKQNHSNGYIVAVGDDSCAIPERDPRPCLLVQNTTEVTIKNNGSSSVLVNKKIRIYNVITMNCTNPEIGDKLVHLFKGCRDKCCSKSSYYHLITLKTATGPSTRTSTINNAPTTTNCDRKTTSRLSISTITPMTTNYDHKTRSMNFSIMPTTQPSTARETTGSHHNYIILYFTGVTVLVIMVILVLIICCIVTYYYRRTPKHTGTKQFSCQNVVKQPATKKDCIYPESLSTNNSVPEPLPYNSEPNALNVVIQNPSESSAFTVDSLSGDFQSQKNVSTALTENEYTYPESPTIYNCVPQPPPDPNARVVQNPSEGSAFTVNSLSGDSQSQKPIPTTRALIIYSPNTVESEQNLIHSNLISKLQSYDGIETLSHDLTVVYGSVSEWLESEVKNANVVLCVCNKEFKDDWEGSHSTSKPIVQSLKHLILGTVQSGKSLSKYAVVLLDPSHKDYIPTMYLQSDPRQFTVTDSEAIARFVLDIPYYAISN